MDNAALGCLAHFEFARLHHVAIEHDLDLVLAGRPAVGIADLEVGDAVANTKAGKAVTKAVGKAKKTAAKPAKKAPKAKA